MNSNRIIWAAARSALESSQKKNKRNGSTGVRHWEFFEKMLKIFVWLLKVFKLYEKGINNALTIKVNEFELSYENLPLNFNDFKILHITDLHLDGNPNVIKKIAQKITNLNYDICLMTGDFRMENHGSIRSSMVALKELIQYIKAPLGIYATLGNHDSYLMVNEMEKMGIKVLTNETVKVERESDSIVITGVDDVHYYFTDNAINCMETASDGFKIAMVHSPEMYDIAAQNSYNLYLCGHTHGGQICLPGGRPIFKHLYNGGSFFKGLWKFQDLVGYTSEGVGTSGIPIRFNSSSEITLITLKSNI